MSYSRKSIPHRCISCGHRRTLPKLWAKYERPPKCRQCGYYRLTPCREQLRRWKKTCLCDGYWFPHRKNSKFCWHNPNVAQHVSERHAEMNRTTL